MNTNATDKVTIELNARWVKIIRSPVYFIVSALQGVSISFAPLFLYWCGQGKFALAPRQIVVPLCFGIIFGVPMFYMLLGGAVIRELRKK